MPLILKFPGIDDINEWIDENYPECVGFTVKGIVIEIETIDGPPNVKVLVDDEGKAVPVIVQH